jgi:HD-GYP domain-containing protein (c-di-GMP phosphodiesterase class II)
MGAENASELLGKLLEISVELSSTRDRRVMLQMILTEARHLCAAQAGTLYVRHGAQLEFVVAQNDAVDLAELNRKLQGQRIPISEASFAGFVAMSGRVMNVPDSHRLSSGAPFHVNRDFDVATGYRTVSMLGIPLKCPDGQVVGVLQLINRLGPGGGGPLPFVEAELGAIRSLASLAAVSIHNALLMEQLKQAHLDSIIRLSVVAEFRDRNTAEHIQRISHLCAAVAREMRLDHEQVELIQCASTMHDIGKIGIPDSILLKPGPLTPDERKIVESHTIIGAEILGNPTNDLMVMARDIAVHHHERFDGAGYPHHLKGDAIPLSARITCMADVWDALATKRCYKNAYPLPQVRELVEKEVGKHFDPHIAKSFFNIIEELSAPYLTQADPAAPGYVTAPVA